MAFKLCLGWRPKRNEQQLLESLWSPKGGKISISEKDTILGFNWLTDKDEVSYAATRCPDENLPQHLSQMGPGPVGAPYPRLTPLRRRGPGVSPQSDAKRTPFELHKLAHYGPMGAPSRLIKRSFASALHDGLATPLKLQHLGMLPVTLPLPPALRRGPSCWGRAPGQS
ncbi:hypothetical protein Q8A67_023584 [Cirrhinus molitorella]|uniref:Uncharacterized protein n=1 Tax=Cirrhinus molitorella TaxID=172907 RepID=A0AA88TCP7_9TELE|nr:hypothetical protein Q8A67_023584 [Cirrhinus molitorella]